DRAAARGRRARRGAARGRPAEPRGAGEAGAGWGPPGRSSARWGSGARREGAVGRPKRGRHESGRSGAAGDAADRQRPRRVTEATSAAALDRYLRSLGARDTSPHTQRSYKSTLTAYFDWLSQRGVDWRTPTRTDLRAYLAELGSRTARSSTAQRLAAIRS